MDVVNYPPKEMKKGYKLSDGKYICGLCQETFTKGEIYKINGKLYDAEKAVEMHIEDAHGGIFQSLLMSDKKYTGLTEKQREILRMMYEGLTDKEISACTNTSPSTVRHQRFMFRERAKQARLFLSIYELASEAKRASKISDEEQLIEIHGGAKMVDERYSTTKSEEEKILDTFFESQEPLRLKVFSSKDKKKIVILKRIAEEFEKGKMYSEKEVNAILRDIYSDYVTLRRYLIEYGFMDRNKDCTEYRVR